ncbi:protein of unknown function [Geodermatophilus obscurus]|uniref:DUF4333 domain-containing protein n=1 Tax=Geodermatophilus obscurus TaxID=1861 RepID=A0A1I5HRM7_9ACTN|nr:DUF4333 domain-containing protein [Geodermatophilus obscurus]SFO50984.1 protein of unknown function [Geodermatophilus obscurus]
MTQVQNPYGSPNQPHGHGAQGHGAQGHGAQGHGPQGHGPYAPPSFPAPGGFGPGGPGFAPGTPNGFGGPPAKKRTGAVVGSILAALVVAGLGIGAFFLLGGKVLDTAEAERQIVALTEEQAGVTVTDVTCPEDVELAAGTVSTCTAQVEGQEVSYTVEQTDDEGNVTIASEDVFVQVADVEAALVSTFATDAGLDVTASCDADDRTVLVAGDGLQLTCTATLVDDPSDTGEVLADIDAEGNVTFDAS